MNGQAVRVITTGLALVVIVALLTWRFAPSSRALTADFFAPFMKAATSVTGDPSDAELYSRTKAELVQEVKDLQAQLQERQDANATTRIIARENRDLRRLLRIPERPGYEKVAARIISRDAAAGGRHLRIDQGRKANIEVGQAVLSSEWLLGRVEAVSEDSAEVITISDPNCRTPAQVVDTPGGFGILVGKGEERWESQPFCLLQHLPRDLSYREGALVVTSRYSEMIPPDIPIGELQARSGSETIITVNDLYKNAWVKPKAFEQEIAMVVVLVRRSPSPKTTQDTLP